MAVLEVRDLAVTYESLAGSVHALRGLSLDVEAGACLGLMGESGSGKTTVVSSTLMLFPTLTRITGSLRVAGVEMVGADRETTTSVRWQKAAAVIQAPGRGFNPARTLISQIAEPLRVHRRLGRQAAGDRSRELASMVGLDPDLLFRHPSQLSGGQLQRAMLAMALTCDPELLVLDEPTSGLDAATRAEILGLLRSLLNERRMAMLVVSHDLAAVGDLADEVMVLYGGMVMEAGRTGSVLTDPSHPYTRDLVSAYPAMTTQKDLRGIRGSAPDPLDPPAGCPYHPRCTQAVPDCRTWAPVLGPVGDRSLLCLRGGIVTLLDVAGVSASYRLNRRTTVTALEDVSVRVREGEVVGVVGQTGSGKSTLALVVVGLVEAKAGRVTWDGIDRATFGSRQWATFPREVALVMQDPYAAVSPRFTVAEAVTEPLDVHGVNDRAGRRDRAREVLAEVGLPTTDRLLDRPAHQLSGGQLQRVALARALVLGPRLLVADEPTSMLDASEQAKLMTLLKDLQVGRGMALLLVSHDLALVRKVADTLVVLDGGRVVESGPAQRVISAPAHPVTRQLLAHAPRLGEWRRQEPVDSGV